MSPGEIARTAISEIRGHKLRSSLTLLGIILGTLSITVMTSFLDGIVATVWQGFGDLGYDGVIYVLNREARDLREQSRVVPVGRAAAAGRRRDSGARRAGVRGGTGGLRRADCAARPSTQVASGAEMYTHSKRGLAGVSGALGPRRPLEFRTVAKAFDGKPIEERCEALADACGRQVGLAGSGRCRPVMGAPRFGLVIVGDEILSGKRADKHLAKVIELLGRRGLALAWAHYAGDDRAALIELYGRTFAGDDVVFSCGGIGSTPDDHTRHAAAAALGLPLVLHPEAEQLIAQRCADMAREGRLKMNSLIRVKESCVPVA